ncbi:MAG: Crp/Fnr family transcriptional regulator [Pseudomonas sp.]|uniref:Crp/Fnr family transcriptional regulator n=1 Tax=Pseudomonas sp. TaxID=306 RepID=UPI001220E42D|nr:Crp/Fnr family transcriptional regulator [Pseudomonas sp.]RZI76781.1 MAG: Crp/Fnr family transcriptional regulator [Pseudomonas sp.]
MLSLTNCVNAIIERLSKPDQSHLLSGAEDVPLALSQVLWQPGEPVAHVYFPTQGFVCLIATGPPPSGLEMAMIGREGMVGVQAVLGSDRTPFCAVVQGEGRAWRMATDVFQEHLVRHPASKRLLDRYATFRFNQIATLAHCLCHHEVGPRLARWLLMSQDRAGSNNVQITQEALGSKLGVRRVSVTVAATALQDRGVIAYHRGHLQVLDRMALEQAACDCYRSDLERYAALFYETHSG